VHQREGIAAADLFAVLHAAIAGGGGAETSQR